MNKCCGSTLSPLFPRLYDAKVGWERERYSDVVLLRLLRRLKAWVKLFVRVDSRPLFSALLLDSDFT